MPIPTDLSSVKGFLSEEEGEKLYSLALESSKKGLILELGSYCGKSTIYIGSAVKDNNSLLYAVDHHRGSESIRLVRNIMIQICMTQLQTRRFSSSFKK